MFKKTSVIRDAASNRLQNYCHIPVVVRLKLQWEGFLMTSTVMWSIEHISIFIH